jgi:hypothetical protein
LPPEVSRPDFDVFALNVIGYAIALIVLPLTLLGWWIGAVVTDRSYLAPQVIAFPTNDEATDSSVVEGKPLAGASTVFWSGILGWPLLGIPSVYAWVEGRRAVKVIERRGVMHPDLGKYRMGHMLGLIFTCLWIIYYIRLGAMLAGLNSNHTDSAIKSPSMSRTLQHN